jgi:hypothetical protein
MKPFRPLLLVLVIFASITAASTLAFAGEPEFHAVVNAIETQYGVRRTHVPMLGFALFFVRPEGVSDMKLAVFEDFHSNTSADKVIRLVENSLGPGWYPFVRVRSRNSSKGDAMEDGDGETTLIYASPSGGKLRMMIVNLESEEATVVELKLSGHAIQRWLQVPKDNAEEKNNASEEKKR